MAHSSIPRPVNSRLRALLCSMGLLAASLGAAAIASREKTPPTLGERVAPEGWAISFAPPADWRDRGEVLGPRNGRFRCYAAADDQSLLSFGRAQVPRSESLESICTEVMATSDIVGLLDHARNVNVSDVAVAGWPGMQFDWTPEFMGQTLGAHVYFLGVFSPVELKDPELREVYFVELRTPPPLMRRDTRLWNDIVAALVARRTDLP